MKPLRLLRKYFLDRQPATGPVKQSDFAMHLESVDLGKYKKALLAYGCEHRVLAAVEYQRKSYEILQLEIPSPEATKRLLIFAGVHGNEFAAMLAVADILEDIQQHKEVYKHWNIRIITPINPVGVAHQSRYNETGNDINRDFKDFKTTGARLQKEAIETFQPDVIISLHEGPQRGFFVIAERSTHRAWQEYVINALQREDVRLAAKSFLGMKLAQGWWSKPRIVYALQKLFGIYTLGRFAHERNIPLLTTESSWASKDVAVRKRAHVVTVRAVNACYLGPRSYNLLDDRDSDNTLR